ncbi:hypothetical protein [Tardiphaga sp.]|uniref:hypothetical protein n=1 Tax=Tardiphaga sp. TaxID=1926292 RepID=UPI002634DC62|nr:hypothetical protein [Tardiphaga sp.]MDB5620762.1 hypothetical protein [Tardiphaga sp.]
MAFPVEVDNLLASNSASAGVAFLIRFSFRSATKLVWTGFGRLPTLDGAVWEGVGDVVNIGGISGSLSGTAPSGTLTASGVSPDLLPRAIGGADDYLQRPVQILLQAFDDRRRVGNPCPLDFGLMTGIEVSRNGDSRSLAINYESPYVGRSNPRGGWYSDRDQQLRFPGDRGCERVPFLLFHKENWPAY